MKRRRITHTTILTRKEIELAAEGIAKLFGPISCRASVHTVAIFGTTFAFTLSGQAAGKLANDVA